VSRAAVFLRINALRNASLLRSVLNTYKDFFF